MSEPIEEHKLSEGNIRSENNAQQWEEGFADEMVNIIENLPEKEDLISVLNEFVQGGKVPTQGLQVLKLVNSITNDITSSRLDEGDKKSLNDDFSKFRGLLPQSGNWIDVKVSGGAYPRYRFILSNFFEIESKREAKKIENITNQKQRLSHEIEKIKQDRTRITNEKAALQQSLNQNFETTSDQNQMLERAFREIEQQHLVHQNEKEELSQLIAGKQAEKTRVSDTINKIEAELEQMRNNCQELISETKAQRTSHFNATRSIAVKKQAIDELYNMEQRLGPVQDEIRIYSQNVKEGEKRLETLMSELNARTTEYNRFAEELNRHRHNQELQNLNNNLQAETNRRDQIREGRPALVQALDAIRQELQGIRDQAPHLDKSIRNFKTQIQKCEEDQTKNVQTQQELNSGGQNCKERIATLENEIEVLLENELIGEQSLQTLQQEAENRQHLFERDLTDFRLYERNNLAARREIENQIRQSEWVGIDRNRSFGSSFIFTLLLTILCSLVCVILYNLPQGTLSKLFEI